jgi:hypothetical protein
MKYIKRLAQSFYTVELDNKFYISNQNGFSKRISFDQFDKLNTKE